MENATRSRTVLTPSLDKKQGFTERIKRLNWLFILTVIVPTAFATLYYGLVASDVYVSESRFVVRSAERHTQTSVMGALLQGTGFARTQDDTYPVIDYIQSRDALSVINQSKYVESAFSTGDILSRFHASIDDSFEALWKYYNKHIVSVALDPTSGITTLQVRAYTARDSERINAQLLAISEQLINRMNQRASSDTVQFAQHEVDLAAEKAKDAAAALAAYRNLYTVFDPDRQSALQLQQVTGLQTQMFAAQNQLMQLLSISPENPQVPVLRNNIETLQKQIQAATGDVAGSKGSLSQKAASYARLQLDAQFADKQLGSAMAALESARGEAERKQLYLERLVQPNTPDIAIEPKRLRAIATAFVIGLVAWASLSLLIASVREHRD